jgi:diaminopimelate decarboxylase
VAIHFNQSPTVERFWRERVRPLLGRQPTPFYLFSITPIQRALAELDRHFGHLPVRHWLSCKTQPLRPLLQWWRQQGRPIEVVSEFEFLAALQEGFPPERILINGPAKHRWLPRHPVPGLCVNFDSVRETAALAPLARRLHWITGVRLNTREEFDPESPEHPTQFGMVPEEVVEALNALKRCRVTPQVVHFHLRTNVASAAIYERAFAEVAAVCRRAQFAPRFVDCGGGFPPPHVRARDSRAVAAGFDLKEMARVCERALKRFPAAEEIWFENGRWLSARSGVLVVKILEVKERRGMRHLICDGGRTTKALISTWEQHDLLTLPDRGGPACLTTVNGPTCMAFDQLARRPLPRSLRTGDHLIWLEAGAYHLPWETRFSHGLAAVFWHDGRRTKRVRARDDFACWWGQWA